MSKYLSGYTRTPSITAILPTSDTAYWFNFDDSAALSRTDSAQGKIFLNLSRRSGKNGYGIVASLRIVIDDNLDGIAYPPGIHNIPFRFIADDIKNTSNVRQPVCYTNDMFIYRSLPTGLQEPKGLKILIYPNPAKDLIHIPATSNIQAFELYDVIGRTIISKMVIGSTNYVSQDIRNLNPGTYIIKVYGDDGMAVTNKIFVE